jgi:hypothetical protein
MIFILALLPATMLVIAGYIVLFVSNRSEGQHKTFGRYLGFWAFTLAGLVILGALFAAASRPYFSRFDGQGNAGFMMRGGAGFGPGFMMRRFDRRVPPAPGDGRGPGGPGGNGPGPQAPAAPAPNGTPAPGGA